MSTPLPSPRDVSSPGLAAELRALAPWAAVAVAVWGASRCTRGSTGRSASPSARPGSARTSLAPAEQRLYRELRAGLFDVENQRAATKAWPEVPWLVQQGVPPFAPDALTPPLDWTMARDGLYVTYLGVPKSSGGLRWLVLFIEPEKQAFAEQGPPPPVDEEHHTLPDGTALHVTVWTAPDEGPRPQGVLAFPVAEGWTQRLGQ